MTLQVFTPESTGHPKHTYRRSCKMTGITGYQGMVDQAPNGFQSLTPTFYDKVNACITSIEANLPR